MTATLFIVLVRMLCWYKGWRIVRYDGQPEKETEKKNSHEPRC